MKATSLIKLLVCRNEAGHWASVEGSKAISKRFSHMEAACPGVCGIDYLAGDFLPPLRERT